MDPKGVSAIHGRWIEDGRPGLKEKEEREGGGGAAGQRGRGWRRRAIAGRPKLAKVERLAAAELRFRNRKAQEKEESEANLFPTQARSG